MTDSKSSSQFYYDTAVDDDHKILHIKVRDLENRNRRNNLQLDGLSQARRENWHGRKTKIEKLIKEKLGSKFVEIECTHRIGKEERGELS